MARNLDIINTERLTLRGIKEEDTPEIVCWRVNPDVYSFFKSPRRINIEEHLNWYHNLYLDNNNRFDWMCIEKTTNKKIGVFGLMRNRDTVEVNYLLAPEAQHKGYASESIDSLIKYAKEKWNITKFIAEIHKDNTPSIALIKRLGFTLERNSDDFVIYGIEV